MKTIACDVIILSYLLIIDINIYSCGILNVFSVVYFVLMSNCNCNLQLCILGNVLEISFGDIFYVSNFVLLRLLFTTYY